MCPITYGVGPVKKSELVIYNTQSEKEAELTVYRQRFTYCKAYWGIAKLCSGLRYEASLEALTWSILEPGKHPGYRYRHQKTGRHRQYQFGSVFTMDGFGGLHGQDYQQTKPQSKSRAVLMYEFKKADKSGPPPWRYTLSHATDDTIMIIENAYEEAFNDVVQSHGRERVRTSAKSGGPRRT